MHRFNAGAAPQRRVLAERKNARKVPGMDDRLTELEKLAKFEYDANGDIMPTATGNSAQPDDGNN